MKYAKEHETPRKVTILLRYWSSEHRELIRKCAEHSGLSMNDWIIRITLRAARREAAEAARHEEMVQETAPY